MIAWFRWRRVNVCSECKDRSGPLGICYVDNRVFYGQEILLRGLFMYFHRFMESKEFRSESPKTVSDNETTIEGQIRKIVCRKLQALVDDDPWVNLQFPNLVRI